MSWLDLIDHVEAVRSVFGAAVPSLEVVRLLEVALHEDGPSALLRFDLAEFPDAPPQKWVNAGHNTVQVRLALDDVLETKVQGWTRNNLGKLSVHSRCPAGVAIQFSAAEAELLIVSRFARLDKISAYCDSRRKSTS
jgi:hypothetical protein